MSLITDNGWFGLAGAREVRAGVQRVATLRFSDPGGNGDGYAWVDVDDIVVADVKKVVARGTFALQEPAAADPAVVDNEDTLLSMMESDAPRLIEVHASVAAQSPGFFIAWERALERFRAKRNLANLQAASEASALDVALILESETPSEQVTEAEMGQAQRLLEAVAQASNGATTPQIGWFIVGSKAIDRPEVAIGPAAWIAAAVPGARVKVAVELPAAPAPDGQPVTVRSGAAALYAGVTAMANEGKLPPEIAAKLDVLEADGLLSINASASVTAEVDTVLRAYQAAVSTTEVGV